MENEKIIEKSTGYGLNIAGSKVDSLRLKEDLQTVVRVYGNGQIGVAGRKGECADKELFEEAESNLSKNIAYPCLLSEGGNRSVDIRKTVIPAGEFVKTIKKLMARLEKTYPDFIFANKIKMDEREISYRNSKGADYFYANRMLTVALTIKEKSSANIMDLFYGATVGKYNEDEIVEDIGKLLNVYGNKLAMPEEDLPVIINYADALQYALSHLTAEMYSSGASLFNGKLGEKVFDGKVNVFSDRAPADDKLTAFFDAEGVVNENDKFYYVKDGVLCGLATYKRSAQTLNLPLSGGGYAEFDGVPSASFEGVTIGETAKSLKDIVKGKAIHVCYCSGGDMTPDGTLGIPVQLAYLYDNGKLVGTLPEFSVSANIFDLLGKDFCGVAKDDVFSCGQDTVIVGKFKINRAN